MREELTSAGIRELRTAQEVDEVLQQSKGTVLVVVNSICGCAAGAARPAVRLALQRAQRKPGLLTTVFAGQDKEATERARSYFIGYPPSSPSIALLKDGEIVKMVHRHEIEGRSAEQIANVLVEAFQSHC
jgi:putative YphP/YqiW family bacilliredoxin